MTDPAGAIDAAGATDDELRRRIAKLERINAALMSHVERITDKHEGAYSLFQTAIMLDERVRRRTEELTGLMHELERSNSALESARDEAEQANRSKTRFLAAASHDLLQPLHAARLSIAAVAGLSVGPAAAGAMGRVERGLIEIEELIRTLLDISKLDAGVVRPSLGAVPLADLIDEVDVGFRQQAEAKGLRLAVRCAAGLTAESDPRLLGRIVGNLVSNAVRYTTCGGVVVAARRHGAGCRIDVVDSGCGIPAAEQEMVFEEFYRGARPGAPGAFQGGEKGLGLGLSIVRRMAATLGHPLAFRSRAGRGTWFTLILPAGRSDEPVASAAPGRPASATERRILVSLGDGAEADAMRKLLEGWGIAVATASGELAAPDLIVAAHAAAGGAVPDPSVAELRQRFGGHIPVILLADEDAGRDGAVDGCSVIARPVRPAQLRSLVSFLLP